MDEPTEKKFTSKYIEIALMASHFVIPFFGLQMAIKNYLRVDHISTSYFFLLLFIGGNIMTWLIFLLDGRSLKVKLVWTAVLIMMVAVINVLVWQGTRY